MKYAKLILLTMLATLISCSTKTIEQAEPLLYGAGAYGIADQIQDDKKISVGAGVGGYFLSKAFKSKKKKSQNALIEEAKADGKQLVMMDIFERKYASQRGNEGHAIHEVRVPFESYTTSDGVILEAHEKVVLTR